MTTSTATQIPFVQLKGADGVGLKVQRTGDHLYWFDAVDGGHMTCSLEHLAFVTCVIDRGSYGQGPPKNSNEEYSWISHHAKIRAHFIVSKVFDQLVHVATIMETVDDKIQASGSDKELEAEAKETLAALMDEIVVQLKEVNLEGMTLQEAMKVAATLRATRGNTSAEQVSVMLI